MYLEGMGLEQVRVQHNCLFCSYTFTMWLVFTCTVVSRKYPFYNLTLSTKCGMQQFLSRLHLPFQ